MTRLLRTTASPAAIPAKLLAAAVLALGLLAGCSPKAADTATAAGAPAAGKPADPMAAIAAQGKGFTAGAMMSANTVYVLFDAQCPHCSQLWAASQPLQGKAKFVWVPVSLLNGRSTTQGAALLQAANPIELMQAHEKSIIAGNGGLVPTAAITPELEQTMKSNTALFNSLGVDSVPYIVAKNAQTGQVVTKNGALSTPALAEFLGLAAQ